jgi:hypothetical protein
MSMQALNQLVARSIIDPSVVQAFSTGHIGGVISDLSFSDDLRERLTQLEAESWAEYAVLAYRFVKAAEEAEVRIKLPSPIEGLFTSRDKAKGEQVA